MNAKQQAATRRYMETLDKLLTDYAFVGIQALGLVPDFLVQSATQPTPLFVVNFRQGGELHAYHGSYAQHQYFLVQAALRGNK